MLFDLRMVRNTHDNDNEPLTFQSLGLAAALVINRIRNAQTLRELQTDSPEKGVESDKANNDRATREEKKDKHRIVESALTGFENFRKGII
jgi:hypothetical protein